MSSIVIAGDTSGSVTLQAPAVAGTTTLTLPATSGTLALTGSGGDVVGPASSTDNAIARFDSTTGKIIQNSTGILTDAGALSGLTTIDASGTITSTKDGVLFERSGATILAQQIHVANTGSDCYFGAERSTGSGILNGSTAYAFCINQVNNTPVQIGSNNVVVATFKYGGSLALESATSVSGTGITFPATQSASTDANTLDDYEEGTWTPTEGGGLTVVGAFTSSGTYTKVGNKVFVSGIIAGATSITYAGSSIMTAGLPFTINAGFGGGSGSAGNGNLSAGAGVIGNRSTTNVYGTSAIASTSQIVFSLTYVI